MTGAWGGPPLRAPDPNAERRLLEGVVAAGPTGGGGRFYLDPARAQECIDRLKTVVGDLNSLIDSVGHRLPFPPPGNDVVSVNAARESIVMGTRAVEYVRAWRNQIEQTVTNLEGQLAAYDGTEATNRDMFA